AAWGSAHPGTSALVWRLDATGPVPVAAFRPDVPRLPASVMKLVTSTGALLSLGPDHRFETRLYGGVNTVLDGRVLRGPVYVVGGGDPMLSTPDYSRAVLDGRGSRLTDLVRPLRALGVRLVRGPVVVDETVFDAQRTGPQWKASYVSECPPLSGIVVNQNRLGNGGNVGSPAVAAAQRLRQVMRSMGVRQAGPARGGHAPARARLLATATSVPLRTILGVMNRNSDNFIAETLTKDVGAAAGRGTTAAGTAHTAELLDELGILATEDRLVDGSGLSRANRLTATTLVRLLATADADPTWGTALLSSLPRGGEGTLRRRFKGAIAPRVRAKTGYINGVSSLAGIATSPSGTRYAFALLMNDWDITGARATQDAVVTLLARGAGDTLAPL
ncbi:MAG: D-alanyl-D-alanine carboxypeptidase/D-alanyl-D-alanine-endopeptidase, partial [Actinomycetota bacterium]